MYIGLKWLEGKEYEDYTDIFSEDDFRKDCDDNILIHPVITEAEATSFAFCFMTVTGNDVILDYSPFPNSNNAQGIMLGKIHLTLIKNHNITISEAYWHGINNQEFIISYEQVPVTEEFGRQKPRINDLVHSETDLEGINLNFPETPGRIMRTSFDFNRDTAVIEETLRRANGFCEMCGKKAPFKRRSTGEPYLEVHHIIQLANGGPDTTDNTQALCPNCHRKAHYG